MLPMRLASGGLKLATGDTDASIFFFPGFFNWNEFADRIGRVADFYAGYGSYYPKAAMDQLLSVCSGPMKGKLWVDPIPFENAKTCQDSWVSLIGTYRQQNRLDTKGPHRVDEPIGKGMLAIAPTSVLMGESITQGLSDSMPVKA